MYARFDHYISHNSARQRNFQQTLSSDRWQFASRRTQDYADLVFHDFRVRRTLVKGNSTSRSEALTACRLQRTSGSSFKRCRSLRLTLFLTMRTLDGRTPTSRDQMRSSCSWWRLPSGSSCHRNLLRHFLGNNYVIGPSSPLVQQVCCLSV